VTDSRSLRRFVIPPKLPQPIAPAQVKHAEERAYDVQNQMADAITRFAGSMTNWIGVVAEWTPDYTSAERQAINPGLVGRGGGVALSIEYVLANMPVPAGQQLAACSSADADVRRATRDALASGSVTGPAEFRDLMRGPSYPSTAKRCSMLRSAAGSRTTARESRRAR
jgi:hypothetical protein